MPDGPRGEYRRRRRTVRRLIVLTGVVVLVDIGAVLLSIRSNSQLDRARSTVTAALGYDANVNGVVEATLDSETGQRGYLLTGEASYLQPTRYAASVEAGLLAALRRGGGTDPVLGQDAVRLERLFKQRLADVAQTVALYRAGHRARALAMVKSNRGNRLTQQIRVLGAAMVARSDGTVAAARQSARSSQTWSSRGGYLADAASGLLLLFLVTLIREYVVTEQARRSSREAQLVAERLNTARSLFLSRVSHELRTPLGAILGFGQLLEREPLDPGHRETLEHMLTGARHLLAVVDDLLDLSRIEAGGLRLSLEPVQVQEAIAEARAMVSPSAVAAAVGIRVRPIGEELFARADYQRLIQILLNLLSNAIKYNRRGGNVVIGVRREGDRVRIEVADTGIGIPSDAIERVSTPFERLNAPSLGIEGTGLGLTVARGLAEAMGGSFGITSEEGVGTTVWFELHASEAPAVTAHIGAPAPAPAGLAASLGMGGAITGAAPTIATGSIDAAAQTIGTAQTNGAGPADADAQSTGAGPIADAAHINGVPHTDAATSAGPAASAPPGSSGGPGGPGSPGSHGSYRSDRRSRSDRRPREPVMSALYIEDNLAIVRLVEKIFTLAPDLSLEIATEGAAGLARARELRPDLIMLDLHLPDMSGEQVLAALLADPGTATIPVLIVSADASPVQAKRLRAAGAAGFLTKPFDVEQLLDTVRSRGSARAESELRLRSDDLLDATMVGSLHALAENPAVGPVQLGEMLVTFRHDAAGTLADLHGASTEGDLARVAREAHRLAGGAGAVGAGRFRLQCKQLEDCARTGREAEARALEDELDELMERTWAAIAQEFDTELRDVAGPAVGG